MPIADSTYTDPEKIKKRYQSPFSSIFDDQVNIDQTPGVVQSPLPQQEFPELPDPRNPLDPFHPGDHPPILD